MESEEKEVVIYNEASDTLVKEIIQHISDATENNYWIQCDKIKVLICNAIKEATRNSTIKRSVGIYKYVANGSTAWCYSLDKDSTAALNSSCKEEKPTIIKEFRPIEDAKEDILFAPNCNDERISKSGYVWIAENAKKDSKKAIKFLQNFKRYLEQYKTISKVITDSREENVGNFINPTLYISSIGLIYKIDDVPGDTLKNKLIKGTYGNEFDKATIKRKLEVLLEVAESVKVYHDKKFFNGDLKPSNLFVIDQKNNLLTVRNIDYDTCIKLNEDKNVFERNELRTTRIFYPIEDFAKIQDVAKTDLDEAEKELLNLDVAALGNILTYMFLNEQQYCEITHKNLMQGRKMAREYFGFNDCTKSVALNIYDGLGCLNNLCCLSILKKLQELVRDSVLRDHDERIDIDQFIERLQVIIAYLDCAQTPAHVNDYLENGNISQKDILYFANLHRLDQVIIDKSKQDEFERADKVEYEYSRKLSENTPEQYIQQIFYTK